MTARWLLEVAAAFVMPWRAARRIRQQDACLTFMIRAAANLAEQNAELRGEPLPRPSLRLIRGGAR